MESPKLKHVRLSLSEFALPVPRTGSIEAHSGYGRSLTDGQEIHLKVQKQRKLIDPSYQPEVGISQSFQKGEFEIEISGRMDGLFESSPPVIEEIKSTFNIRELRKKLIDQPDSHPYCLQLATYGYFYWLEHKVIPDLTFHLVSTRSGESEDLSLKFDLDEYEVWFQLRLEEVLQEAKRAEKRSERRKKISEGFVFPFAEPRASQVDLIETVENSLKDPSQLLIQAPTGLGKTVGVLYPSLKESLSRGQKVIYVTPKNSQHSVAEDAVDRFQETGARVKPLTLTAKSKLCFKEEPLCTPEYCEYAKDYYQKIDQQKVLESLSKKKNLKAKTFTDLGEKHQVCPFQLQVDAIPEADVVICDYNYVFGPKNVLGNGNGISVDESGKPNLVIDEAHNLPVRTMDYYSPSLSSIALEKMREDIRKLPYAFQREAEELLDGCIQTILWCKPKGDLKSLKITPPIAPFLEQDDLLRSFLSRYLNSDVEIVSGDVVMRLSFYWSNFTESLVYITESENPPFFTTFHSHPTGGIIKITCCDASDLIKESYDDYENVVAFSATLKPFHYYAQLSGLDPKLIKTAEFESPFLKQNRKLMIIPQISTKYADRVRSTPKIAEVVQKIASVKPGNYFVFFPSFEFLEKTLEVFSPPEGFLVLRQERDMKNYQVGEFIEHLKTSDRPTLIFAVQGGVFSEGVDYPGNMIIGAFIVGPPLPGFDLEREGMKDYYQNHYNSGFDYAYAFPAMAKAIQAAGRVIRTETDKGIIVLMDQRFIQPTYSKSMPRDWFENSPKELVSTSILKEVAAFWEG